MADDKYEIDITPPADYLAQTPTPHEQLLGRQAVLLDGLAVAKVALRLHGVTVWVARAAGLAAGTRRWLIAGITIALANLVGVGAYTVHRIQASAVAEERAAELERAIASDRADMLRRITEGRADLQRELDELKQDMRELRRALQRMTGRDPLPGKRDNGPDSSIWWWPDKLTRWDTWSPDFALDLLPSL